MAGDALLNDLKLSRRSFDQLFSDREKVDLLVSPEGDLQTVSGRANLAQALVNRLFTRQGELARLGHPNYGSRLHLLIGERNVTRVQGLAEIYIRESLAQEARLAEIIEISFAKASRGEDRGTLTVKIIVRAAADSQPLSLVVPIELGSQL